MSISLVAKLFTTGAGSEQGSSGAFLHRLCIILETVSAAACGRRYGFYFGGHRPPLQFC